MTPTATESEIGEMSEGNGGVEARVGGDVQQFELVRVAATNDGKLEVKSDHCWCVEVGLWRQQWHQLGKVAGEFARSCVTDNLNSPWRKSPTSLLPKSRVRSPLILNQNHVHQRAIAPHLQSKPFSPKSDRPSSFIKAILPKSNYYLKNSEIIPSNRLKGVVPNNEVK